MSDDFFEEDFKLGLEVVRKVSATKLKDLWGPWEVKDAPLDGIEFIREYEKNEKFADECLEDFLKLRNMAAGNRSQEKLFTAEDISRIATYAVGLSSAQFKRELYEEKYKKLIDSLKAPK